MTDILTTGFNPLGLGNHHHVNGLKPVATISVIPTELGKMFMRFFNLKIS